MNIVTMLVVTYMMNGIPQHSILPSVSFEVCLSEIRASEVVVRHMGGTDVVASCVTRRY
jgi:hypothetical protein